MKRKERSSVFMNQNIVIMDQDRGSEFRVVLSLTTKEMKYVCHKV